MKEINEKLTNIREKFKNEFSRKRNRDNNLVSKQSNILLHSDLLDKLNGELVESANEYFKENNIDDTKPIKKIITEQVLSYLEFVKPLL